MSVFIAKVPVFSGGRGKITLHRVAADCLEDWGDLLEFLAAEAKGKSWVVQPRRQVANDWHPTSPLLPFAKVRTEIVPMVQEEFSAPMLEDDYLKWAQYHLKMEMRVTMGAVSKEAEWHHQTKLREIGFRARRNGLTDADEHEFPDRDQRAQVKSVNYDIENLDLGKRSRLKRS